MTKIQELSCHFRVANFLSLESMLQVHTTRGNDKNQGLSSFDNNSMLKSSFHRNKRAVNQEI